MSDIKKRKYLHSSNGLDHVEASEDPIGHEARRLTSQAQYVSAGPDQSSHREDDPRSRRDWRQIVCKALNISTNVNDDYLESALDAAIEEELPDEITAVSAPFRVDPYYEILHRVHCESFTPLVYSDKPYLQTSDNTRATSHLRGQSHVSDIDRFIERSHGLSFIIVREYRCCSTNGVGNPANPLWPASDSVILKSLELCSALNQLRDMVPNGHRIFHRFEQGAGLSGLFELLFHHRNQLDQLPGHVQDEMTHKHLACFLSYLQQHKMTEFKEVDDMLEKGLVSWSYFKYLLVPEDVYILNSPEGPDYCRGVQLATSSECSTIWEDGKQQSFAPKQLTIQTECTLKSWEFDGTFQRSKWAQKFRISWKVNTSVLISSLPIYPFKYASKEMQGTLIKRGKIFWACRTTNYIEYQGWGFMNVEHFDGARFLIDCQTYKKVCANQQMSRPESKVPKNSQDDLGETVIQNDRTPTREFLLTMPTTLPGFNMDDKQWRTLLVSRMGPVHWDDRAFHSLVLPEDTKDVIRALVTHRVSGFASTDIIRGKGNGLILLLHGPPGTGKTLTAESVAEHAKKPLYRVTCGDIGTKPDAVERYLKSTLRLAKTWDCVVLLDEAEVFLQERSLTDLERNALVSVFLRVLEYYDGILILTSNRVGTLDEGFRSRIQLALEYPKLDSSSRQKVWENFFERMGNTQTEAADLDLPDLRRNLSNLSKYELNGREIRNAISVARPLALSNGAQVDFKCLQKVIGVQQRFLRYLKDMNEGLDDEKVAREEGKR